jgi:hypothetical protein
MHRLTPEAVYRDEKLAAKPASLDLGLPAGNQRTIIFSYVIENKPNRVLQ